MISWSLQQGCGTHNDVDWCSFAGKHQRRIIMRVDADHIHSLPSRIDGVGRRQGDCGKGLKRDPEDKLLTIDHIVFVLYDEL